jgi:hypothetical protein
VKKIEGEIEVGGFWNIFFSVAFVFMLFGIVTMCFLIPCLSKWLKTMGG